MKTNNPFHKNETDQDVPVVDLTTRRMLGNTKGRQKIKGREIVRGKETRKNVDMSPSLAALLDEVSAMTSASVSDIVTFLLIEGACHSSIETLKDRLKPYLKQLRYENYLPTVNVGAAKRKFLGKSDKNGQLMEQMESGDETEIAHFSAR